MKKISSETPLISFYLPYTSETPLPTHIDQYWKWQQTAVNISNWWGIYHWVLQTYLILKDHGLPCVITNEFPKHGVVVSHAKLLYGKQPARNLYVVSLQVDTPRLVPYANFFVFHNKMQQAPLALPYCYIQPWPQISLIKRDSVRGTLVENVVYMGYRRQLVGEFASEEFRKRLASFGFNFLIPGPRSWHDFSRADVILAVRSFDRKHRHLNKPALKLYNAWLAGTPALLGPESAYQNERRNELDYIEIDSAAKAIQSLISLRESPERFRAMVENGFERAKSLSRQELAMRWIRMFDELVIPDYHLHRNSGTHRIRYQLASRSILFSHRFRNLRFRLATTLRRCLKAIGIHTN